MEHIKLIILAMSGIAVVIMLTSCSGTSILNVLSNNQEKIKIENIIFDPDKQLAADIYLTTSAGLDTVKQVSTLVFIYGGSWREGDKSQYQFIGNFFTCQGINVIIPNYRLYPTVNYPDFIEDQQTFFNWLAREQDNLSIDSSNLIIMGHSAGAYNAAIYLLDNHY